MCPYCLGFTNGCIDAKLRYLFKKLNESKDFANSYLPKDRSFLILYEAGYKSGFEWGQFSPDSKQISTSDLSDGIFEVMSAEFGEIYHISGAMLCSLNLLANLKQASLQQMIFFCTIFNKSRIKLENAKSKIAKGESTNILCQAFPDLPDKLIIADHTRVHHTIFKRFVNNLVTEDPHNSSSNRVGSLKRGINLKEKCIAYIKSLGIDDQTIDKIIIWNRNKIDDSQDRNLYPASLKQLLNEIVKHGITHIIILGEPLNPEKRKVLDSADKITFYDLTDFHKCRSFKLLMGNHHIAGQLFFIKTLQACFNAKLSIGMMSGTMDGPAFIGMPTIVLTHEHLENRIPAAGKKIKTIVPIQYNEKDYIDKNHQFNKQDIQAISLAIAQLLKLTEKPITKVKSYIDRRRELTYSRQQYTKFLMITIISVIIYLIYYSLGRVFFGSDYNANPEPTVSRSTFTGRRLKNGSTYSSDVFQSAHLIFPEQKQDITNTEDAKDNISEDISLDTNKELSIEQEISREEDHDNIASDVFPNRNFYMKDYETQRNKVLALAREGKYEDALKLFKMLSESNENDYRNFNNIGSCYLKQMGFVKALEYYNKCLKCNSLNNLSSDERDKTQADILRSRAYCQFKLGDFEEALEDYWKSFDLDSEIKTLGHIERTISNSDLSESRKSQLISQLATVRKELSVARNNSR